MAGFAAPSSPLQLMLVPVITAVVGGIGLMIKDFRSSRNAEHRVRRQLEQAHLEVEFIHSWVRARQQLGPWGDAKVTEEWLYTCYERTRQAVNPEPPVRRSVSLRRLLVVRHLAGAAAKFARLGFWGMLVWINLGTIFFLSQATTEGTEPEDLTLEDVIANAVLGGFFAVMFRIWCIRADKKARQRQEEQPGLRKGGGAGGWTARRRG